MKSVKIYTTQWCSYCKAAKSFLDELKIPYEEIDGTEDSEFRDKIEKITGRRSVPQIVIRGEAIGGYDDLQALHNQGKLLNKIEINK